MSILESLTIGVAQLGAGLSADRLARASAKRLQRIGRQDAYLRALEGSQLLSNQRVQNQARGVSGPVDEVLREATFELEEIDVGRTKFVNDALADQVRRQGKAEKFAGILGLSSTFTDASRRYKDEKRLADLEKKVSALRKNRAKNTAIGGGIPRLGVEASDFEGYA